MVIDVKRCIACWSCTVSCKQEHFLPPKVFWNRVLISEKGKYPTSKKLIYPVLCNHCKDAACVEACPTKARSLVEANEVAEDKLRKTAIVMARQEVRDDGQVRVL